MREFEVPRCEAHAFVCTNERTNGKDSCGPIGGKELVDLLKARARAEGLSGTHWITRTGCLGFCNPEGAVIKVQRGPEAKWFTAAKPADLEWIWNEIR